VQTSRGNWTLKRSLRSALLAVMLACAPVVAEAAVQAPAQALPSELARLEALMAQYRAALAQVDDGAYDEAYSTLTKLIEADDFELLSAEVRGYVFYLAAVIDFYHKHHALAQHYVHLAELNFPRSPQVWRVAFRIEGALHDVDAATAALEHLSADQIAAFRIEEIRAVYRDTSPDQARRFLEALYRGHWKYPMGEELSYYWLHLCYERVRAGDLEGAAEVATKIADPFDRFILQLDSRFKPLKAANGGSGALVTAAEARLTLLKQRAAEEPRSLDAINKVGIALVDLGRSAEALALADQTIARFEVAGDAPFDDLEREKAWTLNLREFALVDLGRFDEAAQQLELAAMLPEHGKPNVSQVVNLAQLYVRLGDADKAEAVIARVGNTSDFGKAQVLYVGAHVALLRGDHQGYLDAVADLEKLIDVAPGAWLSVQLHAGQDAVVAARLVQWLGDRDRTLVWRALRLMAPDTTLPFELATARQRRAQLAAIRQRLKSSRQ